jgi:hypothetical protein
LILTDPRAEPWPFTATRVPLALAKRVQDQEKYGVPLPLAKPYPRPYMWRTLRQAQIQDRQRKRNVAANLPVTKSSTDQTWTYR